MGRKDPAQLSLGDERRPNWVLKGRYDATPNGDIAYRSRCGDIPHFARRLRFVSEKLRARTVPTHGPYAVSTQPNSRSNLESTLRLRRHSPSKSREAGDAPMRWPMSASRQLRARRAPRDLLRLAGAPHEPLPGIRSTTTLRPHGNEAIKSKTRRRQQIHHKCRSARCTSVTTALQLPGQQLADRDGAGAIEIHPNVLVAAPHARDSGARSERRSRQETSLHDNYIADTATSESTRRQRRCVVERDFESNSFAASSQLRRARKNATPPDR